MPSPRYWREVPSRLRLEGAKCRTCGRVAYPARAACPACCGREWDPIELSRRGTVVTSTVVRVAPTDFEMEAPYGVALVETPEGARLMVQLADCDPAAIETGAEVLLEFRKIRKEGRSGILCYGHKAVPVV